jgi:hypothetical protein
MKARVVKMVVLTGYLSAGGLVVNSVVEVGCGAD